MKQEKLYNVIFPVWFLLFFPPIIFLTLAGNFIIDSLVVLVCFFAFKLADSYDNLATFYKKTILKVWIFGFLADILGAAILFIIGFWGEFWGMSNELISAVNYDLFSNRWAVVIVIFSMLVSAISIFLFNYRITFKNQILVKKIRFKLALTIAIITMPWTFLLPTKWFY